MKLNEAFELGELLKITDPKVAAEELKRIGINLSGMYQELEMSSRFVDTHMDISYGGLPVQLHSHSFYEMICCQSNSGVQYLVGTKRYRLQHGDIILVPPGVGHRPLFPSELPEPYRRIVLWFSNDYIEPFKTILIDGSLSSTGAPYLLRTAGTPWTIIVDYFKKGLQEATQKEPGWELALYGNTMQLLTLCWRALYEKKETFPTAEKAELLDDVVSYIESHLGERITLADTAHRFFVSESTISQTFHKRLHVSFYRYVTQRRLIAAKSMILEESRLERIGERVGFADYSSFFRAFKKEFGLSPREYRSMILESQNKSL